MNKRPDRAHPLAIVLVTLFLTTVRAGVIRFFMGMINAEGCRPYSPIMLFQGAPRPHYLAEHRLALALAEGLSSEPGQIVSLAVILLLAWTFVRTVEARLSWQGKLTVVILGFEAVVLSANVLFSAAAAFHHVGWGMPCHLLFWQGFCILHIFLLPLAAPHALLGLLIWSLGKALRPTWS